MKSVAIFDKNPSLALALSKQLESQETFVCTGHTVTNKALSIIENSFPDLVICDPAHMELSQNFDLVDFCNSVRDVSPNTKLLCYSFEVSNPMIEATMEAGFNGCLSKYSDFDQLLIAVNAVISGGVYFDQIFGKQLLNQKKSVPDNTLSAREKEVLTGVAKGLASKQIAYDLEISSKTVETYKSRAIQKLGLTDRSQVVEYALEQRWI